MAGNGNRYATRRRTGVIVAIIIAGVVLLAAFVSLGRKDTLVRVSLTTRGPIESVIATNGKIEPVANFEAHAPASTTVRRVLVHEGDRVKAGQLLLELDDSGARSQVARAVAQMRKAQAEQHAVQSGGTHEEVLTNESELTKAQNQVETAQRNLDALRRLEQQGAAAGGEVQAAATRLAAAQADFKLLQQKLTRRYSTPEVERVQAQADEARAALAAAQDLLRQSEVRAPQKGTVYFLPVKAGQYVNTGDLLLQAADLDVMQVRGFVDEPDIGRLRSGEQVQITWDAVPGREWQGTLTRVPSTVVSLGSRNVGEISCQVNNRDQTLLPNINVNVNVIAARSDNAVIAPREAVHQEDGQRFVYQVVDGKLRRRNVQTGITTLTYIQITEGLATNTQVALGAVNGQALRESLPVRIIVQ
jgi:HlyD family secretion protein